MTDEPFTYVEPGQDDFHFVYCWPGSERLEDNQEIFNSAFDEGFNARFHIGASWRHCPYGLPEDPQWSQTDLLLETNPAKAGWLLGWWARDWFEQLNDVCAHTSDALQEGTGTMACLLWTGQQVRLRGGRNG